MKYGFFLDLDGTLLSDQYQISQFDQQIISRLKKHAKIYIATGKSKEAALTYYQQLNLDTYFITSMGQVIYDQHQNIVFQKTLTYDDFGIVKSALGKEFKILSYVMEGFDAIYITPVLANQDLTHLVPMDRKQLVERSSEVKNIISLIFAIDAPNEAAVLEVKKKLCNQFANQFTFTYWKVPGQPFVINVIHGQANKWNAITKIMEWDHLDQVVAIGNGYNDIEMIAQANIGVAMHNATDDVKAIAKHVSTKTNNESGVGTFLEKLIKKLAL